MIEPETTATLALVSLENYGEDDRDVKIYDKLLTLEVSNNWRKMHGFPKISYTKLRRNSRKGKLWKNT